MERDYTDAFDKTLMEALLLYFDYGLDPGSCGMAVLRHDVDEAMSHAHEHTKYRQVQENNVKIVQTLFPKVCSGTDEKIQAWMAHDGKKGWDTQDGVMYRLDTWRQQPINELKRICNYFQM